MIDLSKIGVGKTATTGATNSGFYFPTSRGTGGGAESTGGTSGTSPGFSDFLKKYATQFNQPAPGEGATWEGGLQGQWKYNAATGQWEWDDPSNASAPSWMGSGAYAKWRESDPDYDPNDPKVMQNWWRSPSVGGGIVWHPTYGWQDRSKIKELYKADPDQVTWDEFSKWGLTPQLDQDWKKYFPNAVVDPPGGGGGGSWGTGGTGGTAGGTLPNYGAGVGMTGLTGLDTTAGLGSMQMPGQWDTATDIMNYFGTGGATQNPWQWDLASGTAADQATGQATSWAPSYAAAKGVVQTDIMDEIKQAAEKAGLAGNRWGTPLGRTAQDIAGRRMAELGSQYTQQELAAEEANRSRQLSAAGLLQGLGGSQTGLVESAKDRAMQAASGLGALGGMVGQYPLTVAQTATGMAESNEAAAQNAINKYYSEYMRNAAENNPYFAMIYQMATGQGVPQQYNPSTMAQIFGALAGIGKAAV